MPSPANESSALIEENSWLREQLQSLAGISHAARMCKMVRESERALDGIRRTISSPRELSPAPSLASPTPRSAAHHPIAPARSSKRTSASTPCSAQSSRPGSTRCSRESRELLSSSSPIARSSAASLNCPPQVLPQSSTVSVQTPPATAPLAPSPDSASTIPVDATPNVGTSSLPTLLSPEKLSEENGALRECIDHLLSRLMKAESQLCC